MVSIPANSADWSPGSDDDREQRLNQVIADYLEAQEIGQPLDRAALLQECPDLAAELVLFFANQDHLAQLTAPLRDAHQPENCDGSDPALIPFSRSRPGERGRPDEHTATETSVRYFGDYELIEILAEGGMGVVYRARQVSLNRELALKMVRAGRFATPADLERFRMEAEAAAHLDHPHVVPIYEIGEYEGHHYFSMKFVEGGNLAAQIEKFTANPRAAVRLVATVARAVHYAHERGILHRDLKPSNILLGGPIGGPLEQRVPLVTDFGLAKRFEGRAVVNLTQSGSIVGTPGYMAPEQAEGRREAITTAADVHALGAILFELLTGQPPFRADTILETLRMIREQEPDRPRNLNPRLDVDIETIVLKCLEKSPGRRYHSAQAMAEDLDRWLADRPIQARRTPLPFRALKWARRRPAAAGLVLVVLAASVLASAGILFATRLKSDMARTGQALLAEKEKRRSVEQEFVEERTRKLRAEEDRYFKAIVAADQALALKDPVAAERLLAECPPRLRNWEWRYLNGRLHCELLTIQGHSGLFCPDFRPDTTDARCQVDSLDGPIWDAAGAPRIRRMHGPDGTAYGVAIDRAGIRMATAGSDGQVKVWDLAESKLVDVFRGCEGWTAGAAFHPNGTRLATAGEDGAVKIWDLRPHPAGGLPENRLLQTLRGHTDGVFGVAFSLDGSKLASAGKDGTARIWDLSRQPAQEIQVFRGHNQEVCSVAFHPGGKLIASGGADRIVRIWNSATGHQTLEFRAAASRVNAIAFSPDGTTLATGSLDHTVNVWDTATGRSIAVFAGHATAVISVAYSADGTKLVSAGQDATVKVWDLASEPAVRQLRLRREPVGISPGSPPSSSWEAGVSWVGGVAFRPASNEVAAAGTDHTVAIWDRATGRLKDELRDGWGVMIALAYDHQGTRLAVAGTDRQVRLWDLAGKQQPLVLSDLSDGFASVAFSPDGNILATGGGAPPKVVQAPEGKFPAAENDGRMVRLWNAVDGREIRSLSGHTGSIHSLAFSADGTRLASAGADAIVRIWDVASGQLNTTLAGHAGSIFAVAFSPDGSRLISAGADQTIRFWDCETRQLTHTLRGHTNWVMGLAVSPDGSRIASAGADQTVRIWDAANGGEVLTLRGPRDRVHGVAFSSDGQNLVEASADGIVRVWEAKTPADPR
jgi:eukaryotic-like serine/threonine-protein kinase